MRPWLPLSAAALLACACTPEPTPTSFAQSETMRPMQVEYGVIESARAVNIRPGQTRVGMVTGALLGGIGGSQIGGGTAANIAGGVAGAVAGGMLGSAIQGSQNTPGVELTIKMNAGNTIAVVQPGSPQEFPVGTNVQVVSDGTNTRVSQ